MRIVEFFVPILELLPEVPHAKRKPDMREKCVWSALSLFIYLVCSQVPLLGVARLGGQDAFVRMRVLLASQRGSLMELGVSPMITASLFMQFAKGVGVFGLSKASQRDQKIVAGIEKLLAVVVSVVQAVGLVVSGIYGNIGVNEMVLIVVQLVVASYVCILLDEMSQRGWGVSSAVSLFIATNVAESVMWHAFSPMTFTTERGTVYEGAVLAFFQQLIHEPQNWWGLKRVFYRTELPGMLPLFAFVVIFFGSLFLNGLGVRVPVAHPQRREVQAHPIKLLYTSSMPVVLWSAMLTNQMIISQSLSKKFRSSPLVDLLGVWHKRQGAMVPAGGLVYYMTPPASFADAMDDVAHTAMHAVLFIGVCSLLSRAWVDVSGQSPKEVASQWHAAGLQVSGSVSGKASLESVAEKYIPTAALLGGAAVGLLSVTADTLGAAGSGSGILLAVGFVQSAYEQLKHERLL